MTASRLAAAAFAALACACTTNEDPPQRGTAPLAAPPANQTPLPAPAPAQPAANTVANAAPAAALPPSVEKALDWLAGAQQKDGGFGGGSHAHQEVHDAHAVPTDPATTAAAAMALIRAGNDLEHGPHARTLRAATEYLLKTVEAAKLDGPQITELTGTQPQAKMGANVDTALTAQYLARLLHGLGKDAPMRPRVVQALDKCMHKIETSQSADGSWAAGGWAPVLQSAQMTTALELADVAGRPIDRDKLALARGYAQRQVSGPAPSAASGATGFAPRGDAAAGVALYASAANARAVAAESKAAEELVEEGKRKGRLEKSAKVDPGTLEQLGLDGQTAKSMAVAFSMNEAAKERAFDARVLDGFGNNGGEEFLSYQMQAESLAIDGGDEWSKWRTMIEGRLAKVQNQDGSWSGHHCITSPVFCTATAISCLTADRDVEWLQKSGKRAAK